MNDCAVIQATAEDLDSVAPLFNAYRQFYGQADDTHAAKSFVLERLANGDSVIFLARVDGRAAGFTQLYPSFSSVAMRKIWVLNDLFVAEEHRRGGVAKRLINNAADYARKESAARLVLATAVDNAAAKKLYEETGWERDDHFDHYLLPLS